jgi:hypothetical protein
MARLEWERASLGTLQVPPYDLSMVSSRRSSKDSFISYGGNRYSVPTWNSTKHWQQGRPDHEKQRFAEAP